ncbi:hypothetical protein B296_00029196 [Ensete ventricosum]|uniref:Uncharacterized protein n=1 Tax=Ensete ventricosum TaxID=4639 RepID=A0A426X6X4_ENSVE|nr:hypothetical protein B296_00029196 [Ensete ventricosum]
MLYLGVTQEWVDEGELPRERTKKNRRWRRPYDVLAKATHGEVVVRVHRTRICMQWRCHQEVTWWGFHVYVSKLTSDESLDHQHMGAVYHRAAGELDYFSAHIRLREPGKSEDKAECKATDSSAMGLVAPWYRRGGTFVESSIPCSHGEGALVIKGAEEVENAKENSKYQDKAEG